MVTKDRRILIVSTLIRTSQFFIFVIYLNEGNTKQPVVEKIYNDSSVYFYFYFFLEKLITGYTFNIHLF